MRLYVVIVFVLLYLQGAALFARKKKKPAIVEDVDVGSVLDKGLSLLNKEEKVVETIDVVESVDEAAEVVAEVVTCAPVAEGEDEVTQNKVDVILAKLQGTRFLKLAVKFIKGQLKNKDSFLRKLLGRAAQNPADDDFEYGPAGTTANVPTRLIPILKKYLGETRTVVGYLWEFGYIPKVLKQSQNVESGGMGQIPPCAITEAVREFQKFNEIPQTGTLTKETRDLMAKARCGNADVECDGCAVKEDEPEEGHRRKKRFSLKTKLWRNGDFKYYFYNYTKDMDKDTVRTEIEKGFREWTNDAPIRFIETEVEDEADFKIFFAASSHGDKSAFDGTGGVLAHAYYPRSGKVHFDEDETYTANTEEGTNLYYVTTHEMGHGLGLRHSVAIGSIMNPYYQGYREEIQLGVDDIDAITTGYGTGSGGVYPIGTEIKAPTIIEDGKEKIDNFCIKKFDAAINDPNGDYAYLFFEDSYIRLEAKKSKLAKMSKGYPKKISEMWPGLAGNFDAGFSDYEAKISYFFKDGKVTSWDWNSNSIGEFNGNDMAGTKFAGLPTTVSAVASYWDNVIFFTDDKYWLWSEDGGVVNAAGFPSPFFGKNPLQAITSAFNSFFKGYIYSVNGKYPEKYVLLRSTKLWNKGNGADVEGAAKSIVPKYKFKTFKDDMNMVHRMPCI